MGTSTPGYTKFYIRICSKFELLYWIFSHLHSLALNKTLCMRQNPKHDVLYCRLLFEDHSCQVKKYLISFDLQLRFFIEVGIPQADAAKLKVSWKHFFVGFRECLVAEFIYNLKHKKKIKSSCNNKPFVANLLLF